MKKLLSMNIPAAVIIAQTASNVDLTETNYSESQRCPEKFLLTSAEFCGLLCVGGDTVKTINERKT